MKLEFTNKMKGASKSKFNNVTNAKNRQCLSADGFSLLPSALRPCLFCLVSVLASVSLALEINTNTVSASTYSISMNVPSSLTIDASAAGIGAKVTESDITVISTCPSGYTVNIVGPSDTTLYKDGDSSNSESNNSTNYIEASTGTKNNPVGITGSNLNTWGYTLTHGNNINNDTFIGLTDTFTELTTSAEATTSSGTTIPVYYGVSVSADRAAGTYKMTSNAPITYALVTSLDCTSYQVAFNSNGGSGTMQNQRIAEETATALTTNSFTGPSATPYFGGWNTAADGSGTDYTNGETVTDLAAVGQTINLYAQWTDCPANKICYDKNDTAVVGNAAGTMGNQSATSNTDNTLMASNFSLANYGFAGWSKKANADTSMNDDDNDGNYEYNYTIYGPNATINPGNLSAGGMKLYAVWVPLAKDKDNNNLTFQTSGLLTKQLTDTANDTLASKPNGYVTALKDERDNQVYAIAKLADDNYWMIENLRLDNNSTTPNWGNDNLSQGFGGVFHGLADAETASFSNSTVANSLYSTDGSNGTYNITYTSNDPGSLGYRMPRYRKDNTSARASSPTSGTNTNIYSYGNYYTWAAAIASTLHYSSPTATDPNGKTSETAKTSICPSGWKLPYGRNTGNGSVSGGFSYLDTQMGGSGATANANTNPTGADRSKVWRGFPNNFLYSGYALSGYINDRGSYGYYWSSSANDNSYAYLLYLGSSYLYPGTGNINKFRGFTVRCVVGS